MLDHEIIGGVHLFSNDDLGVFIRIDHLQKSKAYTMANVSIETKRQDLTGMMFYGTFRLNEDKDKRNAVQRCMERSGGIIDHSTWDHLVEQACTLTDLHSKRGEKAVVLATTPLTSQDEYLLYPLILSGNRSTMIYAHGGSMKTYLAGYAAMIAGEDRGVLVLDWETDEQEWIKRMRRIADGLGKPLPDTIIYRKQRGRLSDDGERIHELVASHGIGLVIVDSVSGAVQGDLNDATPAMTLFDTLGQVGVPALLIHHTNKAGDEYGNVYFHNYVRLQWEAKAERSSNMTDYLLTLTPKKANVGPLHDSQFYDVKFQIENNRRYTEGDKVIFSKRKPPELSGQDKITQYLLAHGSATKDELSTGCEMEMSRIDNAIWYMIEHDKLVQLADDKYGVVQHG